RAQGDAVHHPAVPPVQQADRLRLGPADLSDKLFVGRFHVFHPMEFCVRTAAKSRKNGLSGLTSGCFRLKFVAAWKKPKKPKRRKREKSSAQRFDFWAGCLER